MPHPVSSQRGPESSPVRAALIAAEATMRHNDEISAVFVVTPAISGNPDLPRDVVTILRFEDSEQESVVGGMGLLGGPHVHVPHWARVLLDSTEGVR